MEDCSSMDRRSFLRFGGLTLFISAVDPSLIRATGNPYLERVGSRRRGNGKRLIYLFQRFGADGLSIVVPTEANEYSIYRSFRPTLGIDRNDPNLGPMTPDFACSPLLKNGLYTLWQQGNLAVLPDVGYPEASRSHFDAQAYIDRGTPGVKTTPAGWLNRFLESIPSSGDPLRALAFGPSMPVSLQGVSPAVVVQDLAGLNVSEDPARNQRFFAAQEMAYTQPREGRSYDGEMAAIGKGLIDTVNSLGPSLPPPGINYPSGDFGKALKQLAQLIKSGLFEIEVAEVDFGGWDTHGAQGPRFPALITEFSDAITALVNDLGPQLMQDTVILTASEFGRTARENGSLGTDHGSAWASFVVGGGVRGGIHHGPAGWAGLSDLREDRDLKHSIDFRDLFSEVLSRHMGTLSPNVFPGWSYSPIGIL